MIFRIASMLVLLGIFSSWAHAQVLEDEGDDALFGETEQQAARAAFKDGRIAFERGQYAKALERFEHAYSLSGRSELLFNIGLAADRIREDERALEAFEQYLKETPSSEHREQVQLRVAALREALARQATKPEASGPRSDRAPTPEEVAAAQVRAPERAPITASSSARDDDGVLSTWWFWTGAAVLLIGGGVTAYVLLQPEEHAELPKPNTSVVVPTLRLAP